MPLIAKTLALMLGLVVVADLMFRVGRTRRKPHYNKVTASQLLTVQGATLGLLALLLGFTMSMAESRFEDRRQINIREAAAVSTAYLRADFLPEPQRSETQQLMRSYVEARRAFDRGIDLEQLDVQTVALQREIWQRAATAAQLHPDWDVLSSYVESVNETFDLEAARSVANHTRLPTAILIVVLTVAVATVAITGYVNGYGGARTAVSLLAVPALIAISCAVIVDLDRAWFGYIRTGDRPMEMVQQRMQAEPPASAAR